MSKVEGLVRLRSTIGELPFIRCPQHGIVLLSAEEYWDQMNHPDTRWLCVACGAICEWVGEE